MEDGPHVDAMRDAIRIEAEAQRLLQAGDPAAAEEFARAAARYRESWELAPPRSFGRLIGMLKAALLAGDAEDAARYATEQLDGVADSPPSAYALALAALVLGDDATAASAAEGMRAGSPAFGRAADAIVALAAREPDAYESAIGAIVADFAGRDEHLTGVPIADTALMLDRLAEPRGLAVTPPPVLFGT
jgi:hypothetical protein